MGNMESACAGIFFLLFRFVIVMSSDKADFVCLPGSPSLVVSCNKPITLWRTRVPFYLVLYYGNYTLSFQKSCRTACYTDI